MYQGKKQFDDLQSETLRKTTNPVERHKVRPHASKKFCQADPKAEILTLVYY